MRRFAIMTSFAGTTLLAAMLAVAPLGAQALRERGNDGVPEGHLPPPGMCRIWIDGVPPGQQPAPTDCATAVRNRPANGRVIFGDDAAKPGKGKPRKFRGVGYSGADEDVTVRDERPVDRTRDRGDRSPSDRAESRPERPNDGDRRGPPRRRPN